MLLAAALLASLAWSAPALSAPQPQWIDGLGLAPQAAGGPLAMAEGCPRGRYDAGGATLPHPRRRDGELVARDGRVAVLAAGGCSRRGLVLADLDAEGRVLARTPLGEDGVARLVTRRSAVGLAWISAHGDRYVLHAAVRRSAARPATSVIARRTGAPERGGGISDAAAAFLPDGRLLVVFADQHQVLARIVGGPVVRLGPAAGLTRVRVAVSRRGRIVVAWGTEDAGGLRNVPASVYAAIRDPRHGWSTRRLDRAGWLGDPTGDPELAVGRDGRALLEFHDARRVRLAEAPPGRPFGRARVLAHGGEPGGVAVRDDGLTLATWVAGRRVRAKLGSGPAATLSWDVGFLPEPPRAAFDASGRPQVSWDRYVVSGSG
jgi:hypothetical protein